MEQALGPQTITVTGVPATSHFARVMVAADYRMKRLSMNMEPAPIAGLPSYLEMMSGGSRAIANAAVVARHELRRDVDRRRRVWRGNCEDRASRR